MKVQDLQKTACALNSNLELALMPPKLWEHGGSKISVSSSALTVSGDLGITSGQTMKDRDWVEDHESASHRQHVGMNVFNCALTVALKEEICRAEL
jgi:hypothetical protein